MTAVGVVTVVQQALRHLRILRVVRRLLCVGVSLQPLVLLLLLPVVEALNHLIVLIINKIVILGTLVLVVSASVALLVIVKPLGPLLIVLQVEPVAPLLHQSGFVARFLLFLPEIGSILVVEAVVEVQRSLVGRRVHWSPCLHFLVRASDIRADLPRLILT